MPGTEVRALTNLSPSKFIFEQHRGALGSPLIVLEREQGEHVGHGGFQLGNNFLHAPAEERSEERRVGKECRSRGSPAQYGRKDDRGYRASARTSAHRF